MPRPGWLFLLVSWLHVLASGCAPAGEEVAPPATLRQALNVPEVPVRLGDLAPGTASSTFGGTVDVNGTLFFFVYTGTNHELWKSDGTEAGTTRVKNLGALCGNIKTPWDLKNVGGTLFFLACGPGSEQLWKSDGTEAGTVPVKTLDTGYSINSNNRHQLTEVDGKLFIHFFKPSGGVSVWGSDGTEAGTTLLQTFTGPTGSVSISDMTVGLNGVLYFSTMENGNGWELWKSDGTPAGTTLFKDLCPGSSSSVPYWLKRLNGAFYFSARDCAGDTGTELWKSDGTPAGTTPLKDIRPGPLSSNVSSLTEVAGTLFFIAEDGTSGLELWKSDGTAAGTTLVKDIRPGTQGSALASLTSVGGRLFFTADDGTSGPELWTSDGTAAGTVRVKDIRSGAMGSTPSGLVDVNGALFFTADDGTAGPELWTSNGTAAGTVRVKDIHPGPLGANLQSQVRVGGMLFFAAHDGPHGLELWKSDGTEAGTTLVIDLTPQPASSLSSRDNPTLSLMMEVNGTVFFAANDGIQGLELWKTDGTAAGTTFVKDIRPGPAGSNIQQMVSMGGQLYFSANDGTTNQALWKSDGTAAGTTLVKNVRVSNGNLQSLMNLNGTLFFLGDLSDTGPELWKSDGTAAGTVLVKDIHPGSSGAYPQALTGMNGMLFFSAADPSGGAELWKSDGTAAGTVHVKDICPGSCSAAPSMLTNVKGTLFFTVEKGLSSGKELWKSDGTEAGTVRVKDLSGLSNIGELTNVNGTLFFRASQPSTGPELWKSDGTEAGTVLVKDINLGARGSAPNWLTPANGMLLFVADGNYMGWELWKSDGTEAGTVPIKDICPGACDGLGTLFPPVHAAGLLFFFANDGTHGAELWRSDGTEAGTFQVADLNPGASGSGIYLSPMLATGKRLFFAAQDGQTGVEPWVLPLAPIRCPAPLIAEATNPSGAEVPYPLAALAPDVSPLLAVSYSHASGATFPFGTTEVTAAASDPAYPASSCSFRVTVRDSTPPAFQCPDNVLTEVVTREATPVDFPAVTATDAVSTPVVTYSPASGSSLPFGENRVTVTATDAAGNTASCTFFAYVRDTTPAQLQCPANQVVEATSMLSMPVTYPPAEASDVMGVLSLLYSRPSGSHFPYGENPVIVTAMDFSGRTSTCTFTVSVKDSIPPQIQCPADVQLQATKPGGVPPNLVFNAQATDNLTPSPTLSYSPSLSVFPVGTTQVTAKARDIEGNTAECTFQVIVAPPPSVDEGPSCGGCGAATGGAAPSWLLLALGALWLRRVRRQ
jgi:MYXO-CTERM domain-containing protein